MDLISIESGIPKITDLASKVIKGGGVVLLPFDTVYGFAADPRNNDALERIISLKERPESKTMGTAVDSVQTVLKFGQTTNIEFIKDHTPGPYTFVLKATDQILSPYCYRAGTIAIRIPDNQLILELAAALGGVIAQTSANKSGQPNCFSVEDIKKQFTQEDLNKIDLIVDGGSIESSQPSEIWDLTSTMPSKIER